MMIPYSGAGGNKPSSPPLATSKRLDTLLVERGLSEDRSKAQGLILGGRVSVEGQVADKPGMRIAVDAQISVESGLRYVSRGGLKLEEALSRFGVEPQGKIVADVGASTGGFTDCLLQQGAARVYAIDVGYGQLAWKLRQDRRVVVMDRTNIRHLKSLPETIELATIDVSFISLRLVLPAVKKLLKPDGEVIALIKPQFEARRDKVEWGGVVKDPEAHRQVLLRVAEFAKDLGFGARGLIPSPLLGPAGNIEFFIYLVLGGVDKKNLEAMVSRCLEEAKSLSSRS